jgi:hypothetical protein
MMTGQINLPLQDSLLKVPGLTRRSWPSALLDVGRQGRVDEEPVLANDLQPEGMIDLPLLRLRLAHRRLGQKTYTELRTCTSF